MNSLKRRLRNVTEGGTKLVAVKMTSRDGGFGHGPEAIREREKTKAGFIREVEVLRVSPFLLIMFVAKWKEVYVPCSKNFRWALFPFIAFPLSVGISAGGGNQLAVRCGCC